MLKRILTIVFILLSYTIAFAQKWQAGFFIDVKNQKVEGLINASPSGKGPIKDEGFITYKEDKKAPEMKLSASDIRSFKAGPDSFVVAHAPRNESWTKNELDFVKVVLNEDTKLYVINGGVSGGGSGFRVAPGISAGVGGGGGLGGGLGISLGGGQGRGGGNSSGKITWYYGANTADMHRITPENFDDAIIDIMGDEPQIVEGVRDKKFSLNNMPALVNYFKQLKASHKNN